MNPVQCSQYVYGRKRMRCEEPVKILEILRLTEQGYSQREIDQSVKCGKSTVGESRSAVEIVSSTTMWQKK